MKPFLRLPPSATGEQGGSRVVIQGPPAQWFCRASFSMAAPSQLLAFVFFLPSLFVFPFFSFVFMLSVAFGFLFCALVIKVS
jgi:hypothetical protein